VERARGTERFRCRVGHAFSANGLLAGKQDALEAALWAAIVALEERVDLSRRLVRRFRGAPPSRLARYREDIERATARIELLRDLVDDLARQPLADDGQAELAGGPDDTEDAISNGDGLTV
jgi:two-component system chemotaxis response regulator CheB